MTHRILVVFTGGTIGSRLNASSIGIVDGAAFALLDGYMKRSNSGSDVEFKVIEPLSILSENAHPKHWTRIATAIKEADPTAFDGIVVTHGTDTLSHTSAALGLALHDLAVPLVLVSSNHPLDDPHANGYQNFVDAVTFITSVGMPGAFAVYANPDGRRLVHRATRLDDATALNHFFFSVGRSEVGEFDGDGFRAYEIDEAFGTVLPPLAPRFDPDVLLITPYPGMSYASIDLTAVHAVVHDLYHSGTACVDSTQGPSTSLVGFARQCVDRGIPLFIAPIPDADAEYDSAAEFHDAAILPVPGMRAATARAKVMLGLANGLAGSELCDFVTTHSLAYEFLPR